MGNMNFWNKVKQPPKDMLRKIGGGRLKGFTDINPMWRTEKLTEEYGPCGVGWKFDIERLWIERGADGVNVACAKIDLYIKSDDAWSNPIPGIGGSMFTAKESKGLYTSDEAYKMAVTDAFGTACKMLGIGADIYAGKFDGTKYKDEPKDDTPISKEQIENIENKMQKIGDIDEKAFLKYLEVDSVSKIPVSSFNKAITALNKKAEMVK